MRNLVRVAHVDRIDVHVERRCDGGNGSKLACPRALRSVPKDRHPRHIWRRLFKQFEPFGGHAVFGTHETGDVAARPRQAVDEAGADRMVRVACSNGPTVEAPWARMTSGASVANSAACLRISTALAVAQRVSMRTLRPMVQPNS